MDPFVSRPRETPSRQNQVQSCGEREFLWLLGMFAGASLLVAVLAALH